MDTEFKTLVSFVFKITLTQVLSMLGYKSLRKINSEAEATTLPTE